jgi:PAS domain S-box-containing protein
VTAALPLEPALEHNLFADGGETGGLMRDRDWSRSPLGPVRTWPKSLRTCVRIILTSRQPMFVWWGPDLINLYNDAYRDIVGGKHPHALGQPAAEVWREIWDQVGPRARSVLHTNRGTYDESLLLIMQRHGYQEETYYTFSYSPVPDDDGRVDGIICANTDETQRIVDGRRLAVLRELSTRMAPARSWKQACSECAQALGVETRDIPFALIYLHNGDPRATQLVASTGIDAGHPLAQATLRSDGNTAAAIRQALVGRELRLFDLPAATGTAHGAWTVPPTQAVAVPILPPGETGRAGVLVVGLNPYRPFDDRYRDFLHLVASQVASGIANAQAYEDERKRAEVLSELDRTKTEFFSNVSHEFRTPLTLMLAPLADSLADAEQPLPPRQRERQDIIHRNAQRLLKLVNSLLDFSRIEAGRMRATYEAVDLSALTTDLASGFRSAIERAGLELRIDCLPLDRAIYVDREMWEKIVLNLMSNAFKHTFRGTITVSLRREGDHAVLTVADTGVGIPTDQLPHIFDRFHRVHGAKSRTHEGTGIGLALVRQLVKLHDGAVSVASILGQGSEFSVRLPLGDAHLPRDQVKVDSSAIGSSALIAPFVNEADRWLPKRLEAERDAPGVPPPHGAGRILLVDDNADMRDYVRRLLSWHWHVETAADGAEALAIIRRQPPDLVLSDVMMPNMDGLSLVNAVRRDEGTRHIPIILLSARAGEDDSIEGLSSGADDYLTKPFSASELRARVKAHLHLKHLREAAEHKFREREQLLQLVTDQAHIGLIVVDQRLHYVFANPTYGGFIARDPADIIGRRMPEVLGHFYQRELRPRMERALSGEQVEFEVRFPSGESCGQERHFSSTYTPTADPVAGLRVVAVIIDITARKRIEQALSHSQHILLLALQSARTAAWTWDVPSLQLLSSTNLEAVYGLAKGEAASAAGFWSLVHPDDLAERKRAVEAALGERSPYHSIYRLRRPSDGAQVWLEEKGEAYEDDGRLRMRGLTVDVTERMVVQESLRQSEERFRSIVDQSLAGIAVSDGSGAFTTVNARYCTITGYTRVELMGMTKQQLTHPDDRMRNDQLIDQLRTAGASFEIEKRYVRRDGTPVWVHNSVSGVRDGKGILQRMITISIDISERKRIEQELRNRTEQYATLLNKAPIGVYMLDKGLRFREINPVALPAFVDACDDDDIIGRDFEEVIRRIRPEPYASELISLARRTLDTGESHEVAESPPYKGAANRHEWRIDQITLPDGSHGVVCYFRDISKQIAARDALAKHAEDLRRANAELEHFASIASHDLQEPLRMINSYTDILLLKYRTLFDEQGRRYFDNITGGVSRMTSLIKALLSYSQVGKQGSAMSSVALDQIVKAALDNLEAKIASRSASISVSPLPIVHGDPTRLIQLFQNLISNAIKFTPNDRTPAIIVSASDAGERWSISVADNGIGIPADSVQKIFQIFQRLHAADQYPGSGIGLATCKKIVEQHGGDIVVESQLGVGSTFRLTLPKKSP